MADDRPEERPEEKLEDTTLANSSRTRRAPPTIDLGASEVSSETRPAGGDAVPESASQQSRSEEARSDEILTSEATASEPTAEASAPISRPVSPWVVAPVSGAVAAALVIGVGWMLGWPAVQPATPAAPQVSAAAVDGLDARVAGLEAKAGKPATDPAATTRIAALEKSQAPLRDELAAMRAQSEKLAANVKGITSVPGDAAAAVALNARLDKIESAARTGSAQENAKPADDSVLRRVVVASLLDLSVRQGDPFPATLNAAKSLTPDAEALKSLEGFASTGVPTAATLSRELLKLVPKLSPPVQENDTLDSGLVDRLRAGASKLVRIERTDAVGNDRGAVVARVTAAALHNDSNEARRELKTLAPADRAAAQSWIDKADARDAALAASRQFAADAITALAKPTQ
jgi:hypothetical protein